MRARVAVLLSLMLAVGVLAPMPASSADDWAQEAEVEDDGGEDPGDREQVEDVEDEGDGVPSETEGGSGDPAADEEGPIWTYQMARLSLLLLLVLALGMAWWWYSFVIRRRKEGI